MADPVIWRLESWAEALPDSSFYHVEAAARLAYLARADAWAMDRVAAEDGLSNSLDYEALSTIRLVENQGKFIMPVEIARRLGMTTASMVNRADRLEKLGYVRRARNPADRRTLFLKLTPEGRDCADRQVRRRVEERERLLEGLTKREAETLSRILRKLSATWLPVTGTLGAAGG